MKRKEFDYQIVKRLYLDGKSLSEVASVIQVSDEDVRRALIRMGVPRRRRGGGDGEKNHQFKGGVHVRRDGYRIARGTRKKPLEHRKIAERALGRPLKREETVHHVDVDPGNNQNTNLVICTHSYHMELHARMRRHPYWSQVIAARRDANK